MFVRTTAALLLALATSATAHAGLLQYTFNDVTYEDGAHLGGYFLQDETTRSIVYYRFRIAGSNVPEHDLSLLYYPETAYSQVTKAASKFHRPGPTNFNLFSRHDFEHSEVGFTFHATKHADTFRIGGWNKVRMESDVTGSTIFTRRITSSGTVTGESASQEVLDYYADQCYMAEVCGRPLIPTRVPEPGSLALFGLAAIGLYDARRRKARKLIERRD